MPGPSLVEILIATGLSLGLLMTLAWAWSVKRKDAGVDKGFAGKITRGPVVAGGLLVLVVVGYVVWQRRARRKSETKDPKKKQSVDPSLAAAAALYRALELALGAHGLTRPPSTPPLRLAEQLGDRKLPLAPEVREITTIYR